MMPTTRLRGVLPGWAVALSALAMMVVSDYKLRVRSNEDSLSASPDFQTLAEIGLYGLVLALLVRSLLLVRAQATPATPVLFLAWLYAGYMWVSAVWSVYPLLALVRGWQFAVTAVLAAALARLATRADLHRLAHWYVATVSSSVVFGLLVQLPRQPRMQDRFNWLFVHPVIAGTWLGVAVVVVLWLLLTRSERAGLPRWPAWAYGGALLLVGGGLLGTQTRGAIGGCTVGVAVLLLVRYRRQAVEVGVLGAGAVVLVGLLFLPRIVTFLSRGESTERITSFNGRTPLWTQAYELVLASPLFGYGTTASRGLFFDTVGLGGAHNAIINVLVDGGLIGFALWLGVLAGCARLIGPALRTGAGAVDAPLLAAVLTFLFVNGGTTEGLGFVANVSSTWLYVVVGWLAVLCRRPAPVLPPPGARPVPARAPVDAPRRRTA